jgi:hypothetical protein
VFAFDLAGVRSCCGKKKSQSLKKKKMSAKRLSSSAVDRPAKKTKSGVEMSEEHSDDSWLDHPEIAAVMAGAVFGGSTRPGSAGPPKKTNSSSSSSSLSSSEYIGKLLGSWSDIAEETYDPMLVDHESAAEDPTSRQLRLLDLPHDAEISIARFLTLRDLSATKRANKYLDEDSVNGWKHAVEKVELRLHRMSPSQSPTAIFRYFMARRIKRASLCFGRQTDAIVIALSKRCPQLSSLNLEFCEQITDACVIALSKGCPQLFSLGLDGCHEITDAAVIALSRGCPELSSLGLDGCHEITDAAVIALSRGCPELSSLDLRGCYRITGACVIALAEGCPNLFSLDLMGCEQITGAIVDECPKLAELLNAGLSIKWDCDADADFERQWGVPIEEVLADCY